jgi:putative ABC transport system substrate-binding protein
LIQCFLKYLCALLQVACFFAAGIAHAQPAQPIVRIASSASSAPFQQVVKSFKQTLREALPQVKFIIDGQDEVQPAAVSLVFTLGSHALKQAIETDAQQNILATMIINESVLKPAKNATAILLKTTARQQLEWHRRVLPEYHRIAVLYNPQINQGWVDEAQKQALRLGMKLIAIPVDSAKKIPAALKQIGRDADTLLAITDKTVYSGKTAKSVLLFSFRNRIPFIGLSKAWVKAGALYALDWDYPALGRQSAAVALKILQGEPAGSIKTQAATTKNYLVNLKTVKHMKLKLTPDLMVMQHSIENISHD